MFYRAHIERAAQTNDNWQTQKEKHGEKEENDFQQNEQYNVKQTLCPVYMSQIIEIHCKLKRLKKELMRNPNRKYMEICLLLLLFFIILRKHNVKVNNSNCNGTKRKHFYICEQSSPE